MVVMTNASVEIVTVTADLQLLMLLVLLLPLRCPPTFVSHRNRASEDRRSSRT